jgi:hypothetical protein
MSDEDSDAVAEFIRSKGVTRCPTACVLPTQGLIDAADHPASSRTRYGMPRQENGGSNAMGSITRAILVIDA